MNALRETLARRADETQIPVVDVDQLVATGERRVRRRRATAVLGSAAAVVVTVVLALFLTSLTGTERSSEPVKRPKQGQSEPARDVVRTIVYAELGAEPGPTGTLARTDGRFIHYGNQLVDTGRTYVNMDVTDDGFAWTTGRGQVWFSDGTGMERIGSHACTRNSGGLVTFDIAAVVSGNAGSLLAWFDCTNRRHPSLVVYDTGSNTAEGRQQVTRQPAPSCSQRDRGPHAFCDLMGVFGRHVYWQRTSYPGGAAVRTRMMRFDARSRSIEPSSQRAYRLDLRSDPRTLVVGDSWATGTLTDGLDQGYDYPITPPFTELQFVATGSRLVTYVDRPDTDKGPQRVSVFANATHDRVRLILPDGYRSTDSFALFEWLDDDTVALAAGANTWGEETKNDGDILRCTLSIGRCVLAVPGGRDVRIVPHLQLPG